jgi:hypothetical protein
MDTGAGAALKQGFRLHHRFYHRHNADGSYDSICMYCFLTAGTSPCEEQLRGLEQGHISKCWRKYSPLAFLTLP